MAWLVFDAVVPEHFPQTIALPPLDHCTCAAETDTFCMPIAIHTIPIPMSDSQGLIVCLLEE